MKNIGLKHCVPSPFSKKIQPPFLGFSSAVSDILNQFFRVKKCISKIQLVSQQVTMKYIVNTKRTCSNNDEIFISLV